jgi:hypothetical protein
MTRCRRSAEGATPTPAAVRATFEEHSADLGFAFLLLRYVDDPRRRRRQITGRRGHDPDVVWPLFWAFRIMVALGFAFIGVMAYFFYRASFRACGSRAGRSGARSRIIPTPWIAAEMGWFVAEFGRQPWTVDGVLPTAMSVSHLGATELLITLAGFVTFYSVLFVVEMGLMLKYIRKGPFQDVEETEAWRPATNTVCAPMTAGARCQSQPPRSNGHDPFELIDLRRPACHLVGAAGRAADRLRADRRLRHGGRRASALRGPDDTERRVAINTVGPVWEGNQVWFILGGGAIFAAWPPLYAVSFSGFYLAMFVVLAAFIVRPVAFKYRSKRDSARLAAAWDWALFIGGACPR